MQLTQRSYWIQLAAIGLALAAVAGIIALAGAPPGKVLVGLWDGAFGTPDRIARSMTTLVPLVLCASGLIFTFAAGLYNLGVEGQITAGAIAATFVLRLGETTVPPGLLIGLAIGAGALGGFLWGLLTGALNVYSQINEIFSGLGLNFVADGLALYLVFGPWKRSGVASMSGTEPFAEALHLPTLGKTEFSPVTLAIALTALAVTLVVMQGTYFGLKLRAVGQNRRAAYVQGIPAMQYLLSAFGLCGLMAGLAGALQVVGLFHRLIPGISSNLGFLALLVVMLTGFNPWLILPVAFFFSALNVGGLQLPLSLNLESSLSGVIQGMLVLFVLLGRGFGRQKQIS